MPEDPHERFNRRAPAAHRPARGSGEGDPARGELWGLCKLCDRWYFVAFEPGLHVRSPRCPVCASVPASMTLRVAAGREEGRHR